MEGLVKGDIVVVPFPYSNLTEYRRRPAFVLTNLIGDDIILCQITKSRNDKYSIEISDNDFLAGSLNQKSNIRPNKIFTFDKKRIVRTIGKLKKDKCEEIVNKVIEIIKR